MSGTTWAITGASGFLGRSLASRLIQHGSPVRLLMRSLDQASIPGRELIVGNLHDGDALERLVKDCEVVVHAAAYVHKPVRTAKERHECWQTNVVGTQRLLHAILKHAPSSFLIYISTVGVYGPSADVLDERADCRPSTFYGMTKYVAEQLVLAAIRKRGLRGVVVRPCMMFGPSAPGNLERMIQLAKRGVQIEFDNGRNLKSIAPIENVIDAIVAIYECADNVNGEIFNITGGSPVTMHEIGMQLANALHVTPVIVSPPQQPLLMIGRGIDALAGRLSLPIPSIAQLIQTYAATSAYSEEKLRRWTSYAPQRPVEDALRSIVQSRA